MSKIVDLEGKWAAEIGKAFVAFGSIESITIDCIRKLPRDPIATATRSLSFSQRIELLVEILESREEAVMHELASLLKRAKELAKMRNLIAHNPLFLEFYTNDLGDFLFEERIVSTKNERHKISFEELASFASESEALASSIHWVRAKMFTQMGT